MDAGERGGRAGARGGGRWEALAVDVSAFQRRGGRGGARPGTGDPRLRERGGCGAGRIFPPTHTPSRGTGQGTRDAPPRVAADEGSRPLNT